MRTLVLRKSSIVVSTPTLLPLRPRSLFSGSMSGEFDAQTRQIESAL